MDGMLPTAGTVLQDPVLDGVLFNCEANLIAIHKLPVDRPLAVVSLELERPRHPWRGCGTGQIVEVGIGGGVYAVVRHCGKIHNNLKDQVPLTCIENRARWAAPVSLLQPVLNIECLACERGEIDDHIGSLGHAWPHSFYIHRVWQ